MCENYGKPKVGRFLRHGVVVYTSVQLFSCTAHCCHAQQNVNVQSAVIFSERELTFTFAICYRPSVCLSVCRLSSVVCLSVTFVRPTQAVQIFGNISTALGTLAIH